jgi:hypothetical protein
MNILNSFTRYSCIATNHTRQNKNKPSAVWVVREDVLQTDIIPIDYVCKKLNVNADWYISAPAKFISTVNILEPTYSAFLPTQKPRNSQPIQSVGLINNTW